jgi:MFS family permease
VNGLLLDLRPLRTSATFRRLWLGRSVSMIGSQLTVVAVMFQVWEMTHSPFWSGSVAAVQAVPMIAVGLWGGALIDRSDRRRILVVTVSGQLCCAAVLAMQAIWFPSVPVVLAAVAGQACFLAVGGPASQTVVARLLPESQVAAGLALTRLAGQVAMLAGPAIAGLLIGYAGLRSCYTIDAVTFAAALYGVVGLPELTPLGDLVRAGPARIRDGLSFVAREPIVRGVLLTDLAATCLAMPLSLFPLVNEERFGGDPRTLGLFLSAIAVGGVAASFLAGSFTGRRRLGAITLCSAAVWGLALAGFGSVSAAWASLAFLVVAGAADTVSVVTRGTVVQLAVPDELRGRASSIEMIVGIAGPDLGNLRAGLVAQWTSGTFALISGGLASVAALGLVIASSPGLLSFHTRTERSTPQRVNDGRHEYRSRPLDPPQAVFEAGPDMKVSDR